MATDQIELQAQVLGLLQRFSGTDPLKELFWSPLNYDRMSQRASRRGWPESAASVLVDDPTLLAAGGNGGDFKVLYARLAKDRSEEHTSELQSLRHLVCRLLLEKKKE